MTLNHMFPKIQHVSKLIELIFKGELHCLNLFKEFLSIADTDVFTSKYYIIQWIPTNRTFTSLGKKEGVMILNTAMCWC